VIPTTLIENYFENINLEHSAPLDFLDPLQYDTVK